MNKNILSTLQLCRSLAAFLVLGHHTGEYVAVFQGEKLLSILFGFGFSGVDFFFVLSGFIIFYASEAFIDHPENIFTYLKRRFIRIYPAYWLVIIPLSILFILFPEISNKTYLFTFSNLLESFTLFPEHPKIIGVSWTLSHEIYFYLLFTLLILSRRLLYFLYLIIFLSVVNFALHFAGLTISSSELLNFCFSPYNLEFLLGVSAYYISKKYFIRTPASILLISGFLFFLSPLYAEKIALTDKESHLRILFLGIPAFFILLALVSLERNNKIKISNFFIVLGNASYLLYLIHYPLLSALNKIAVKLNVWAYIGPTVGNILFMLMITVISIFGHKYLEVPLLNLLNKRTSTSVSTKVHP